MQKRVVSFVFTVGLLAAACDGDNLDASCEETNTCPAASCTDGVLNGTETDIDCGGTSCEPCDDSLRCTTDNDCQSGACGIDTCLPARCGDGVIQAGETCDDGNGDNNDSCPDGEGGSCQTASCGDGFVWNTDGGGEECDDGNRRNADSCPSGPSATCQVASCGDGFVWDIDGGTEQCDDGNRTNEDACPDGVGGTCVDAACGDGFVFSLGLGTEQCDDGNNINEDACPDGDGGTCLDAACGDGFLFNTDGGTEQCDDGNQTNEDACPDGVGGSCIDASCGDGFVFNLGAGTEQCDDGNSAVDDDCPDGIAGTCLDATCDDGFFNTAGTRAEDSLDCSATEATCLACPGELLITELVTGPTAGEYIEIHNPGADDITLSNVYLADFNTYFSETVAATPNAPASDFIVKFPQGASIAAGDTLVVSVNTATNFESTYGAAIFPDFDFDPADANAPSMVVIDANAADAAKLTGGDEVVVAYFWDGGDLVRDIDYVLWGDASDAVDKTGQTVGGSTYQDDTLATSQDFAAAPASGESLNRCALDEGTETDTGGNGFLGHDETSEDLSTTFNVLATPSPGTVASCVVVPDNLIISEYGEGSGNNKWLEIYNAGSTTASLDNFEIGICSNGCADWEAFISFTSGATLAPDEVWVIANPSADAAILAEADQTSGSLSFNGNDGVGLLDGVRSVVDVIGDFTDPGTGFDVAGIAAATANSTLFRKCTVTAGNADWVSSAGTDPTDSEWIVTTSDTFTDIGQHCPPIN